MAQFIKGTAVYATYQDGDDQKNFFEKETSCSFSLTANTIDASNKQDEDPEYDSPEFDDYEGSMSVEGQIKDYTEIRALLTLMKNGQVDDICLSDANDKVDIEAEEGYISSLDIDMPADGLVTGSMSVDIAGAITITKA